jgi:hypothetical protein
MEAFWSAFFLGALCCTALSLTVIFAAGEAEKRRKWKSDVSDRLRNLEHKNRMLQQDHSFLEARVEELGLFVAEARAQAEAERAKADAAERPSAPL